MNSIKTLGRKALLIAAASMVAGTFAVASQASAQAAPGSASSAKTSKTKDVTYSIKRHYGPDNVMANRLETLWQVVQRVDTRSGKPVSVKSIKLVYCNIFPSNLGWTGKASCTLRKIPTGFLITNYGITNSPRVCIGSTCTPSMTMTLGSRIFLDRTGSIVREEPIGDSA